MKFSILSSSRQGGRKYNQDRVAFSYSRDALLMVVADGMGGHFHGEVAAQITVQLVAELFQKQAKTTLKDPLDFLEQSLLRAHNAIGEYVIEHEFLESPRTTCVACVLQHNKAWWAHIGDSRLYMFRDGRLLVRTQDHSKVQQLFNQGKITELQMTTHPERNKIYNCLGGIIQPEIELSRPVPMQEGDTILVCTDGLWSTIRLSEMIAMFNKSAITEVIPQMVIDAETRGGMEGDNVSAIGMTWGDNKHELALDRISTLTMPLDSFTTQMGTFSGARETSGGATITEEDIEKAIQEIQAAIRKHAK